MMKYVSGFYQVDWWNLMKQSLTVGAQLLWSGRYGCNNSRYGCTTVMSYIEINKAVSQWLLTFNLCVSVTWPLTCEFHIPCTHTPEIIDMHRGMCDNYNRLHGLIICMPSCFIRNIKMYKHFPRFITLRCHGQLQLFLVEDPDMPALHMTYHPW